MALPQLKEAHFPYVLRYQLEIDSQSLMQRSQELSKRMCYSYTAQDSQSPDYANCVTAIRALLASQKIALPRVWIGDMPRILMGRCHAQLLKVQIPQPGDLLFLRSQERALSHLMLALDNGQFFHCCEYRGRATIEAFDKPRDPFGRGLVERLVDEPNIFLRYIDARNTKLRKRYGGELIPWPIPRPIANSTLPSNAPL